MLTVAIASGDMTSSAQLLASLQQTGLVKSIKQWSIPADKLPDSAESLPDVVFLDLVARSGALFSVRRAASAGSSGGETGGVFLGGSAQSSALAGSDAQRRAGLPAQAGRCRTRCKEMLSRFMQELDMQGPFLSGPLDRGDGLEGRRGRHHRRGQSGRATLHLRAQARRPAGFCAPARKRASACSISIRNLAFATPSTTWIVSTVTSSRDC